MPGEGMGFEHIPVLTREVLVWMGPPLPGRTLIDCTLGGGGHAEALLEAIPGLRVVGIDRDSEAVEAAAKRLGRFGPRAVVRKANFAELAELMGELEGEEIAGVFYDLGVSSPHLDHPQRGFGYGSDAPLDMRMDRTQRLTAETVVNTYSESRLAEVLTRFGEERFARRIAAAIVRRRPRRPFRTTGEVVEAVKEAIPAPARRRGPHPARRTFQALRIEVNRELEALERSLPAALSGVVAGGRVGVISYHSLEDRIVKAVFKEGSRGCRCPSDLPVCVCGRKATLRVLTRKPVRPSLDEVRVNPRSRSARLRVAERLGPPEAA